MVYQVVTGCKTEEEALEKSDLFIGQRGKVTKLTAHGNLNGEWSIVPEFEITQGKNRAKLAQGIED